MMERKDKQKRNIEKKKENEIWKKGRKGLCGFW